MFSQSFLVFLLSLALVQLAKGDEETIKEVLLEAQQELDEENSGGTFDSIPGHIHFVNSERFLFQFFSGNLVEIV